MAVDVTVCRLLYGGCKRLVTNGLYGLYMVWRPQTVKLTPQHLKKAKKALSLALAGDEC